MSVVYVEVGCTGWTRAWVCDHCGAKKERVPAGTRRTASGMPAGPEMPQPLYEYDEERFEGDTHPFHGWVRVERVATLLPERAVPGEPSWHLCPKCGPALLDLLWSKCAAPTETTEAARNVVEVARPTPPPPRVESMVPTSPPPPTRPGDEWIWRETGWVNYGPNGTTQPARAEGGASAP